MQRNKRGEFPSTPATLLLFVLVYGVVFSLGIYYINRLIARGPQPRGPEGMGHRPLAVAGGADASATAEG